MEASENLSVERLWKMNGRKWQEPGDTQQVTDKILTVSSFPSYVCTSSLRRSSLPELMGASDVGENLLFTTWRFLANRMLAATPSDQVDSLWQCWNVWDFVSYGERIGAMSPSHVNWRSFLTEAYTRMKNTCNCMSIQYCIIWGSSYISLSVTESVLLYAYVHFISF